VIAGGGAADGRVPGYLGRVLDGDGAPAGTCFCVAPGVLVTAYHVVDYIGAAVIGACVRVDPLSGGKAFDTELARTDRLRDLAIMTCDASALRAAGPLIATDRMPLRVRVTVTGHAAPDEPGHTYRFLDAPGEWAGGATRDDEVLLGRMTSSAVVRGMSGAPVTVDRNGVVAGVVSGRYNSADGWLAGTVWVARTEDIAALLDGITEVTMTRALPAAGDGHGGTRMGHDQGVRVLGRLNPHADARRLDAMDHDAAADLLAASPVAKAARVIAALLSADSADYALAVSLLGSIDREIAENLIAAAGTAAAGLEHLPEAAEAIGSCERSSRSVLGASVGPFARASDSPRRTVGYYQSFENGQIHWSGQVHWNAPVGALVTYGAIAELYVAAGGSGGRLGFPLSRDVRAGTSLPFGTDGSLQRFEGETEYSPDICERIGHCGASVYWSSKYGPHAIWGPIGELHERAGGTQGELGFPLSGETEAGPSPRDNEDGTTGICQRFEGGSVYFSNKTKKTIAVPGPISEHHEQCHQGAAGVLGFPVSPRLEAAPSRPWNTSGHFQRFEGRRNYPRDITKHWSDTEGPGGATIYTCEAHGTHCVGWRNGALYEPLGGTGSWLGFPKSDSVRHRPSSADQLGYTVQEFEGGVIIFNAQQGPVAVPAATMSYLDRHAGLRERLGLPLRRPLTSAADELVQFFENGVVTSRTGVPEAYIRALSPPGLEEGSQGVRLVALSFSPETVPRGESITLEYEIEALPDAPSPVILGASLVAETGSDYFDKASDLKIDLTPGLASYRRPLIVPASVPADSYRLVGAVWYPAIGGQRLAKVDRGFVITVMPG
jgi:uncharacterized protein with LGFP repeats